ncbi:MAG: sulfur carrier protein ThiS [Gammaproteobacteria bacterium]|nr:sulfur carrier protein ThiS [Gammaproteobacteria bacterium]
MRLRINGELTKLKVAEATKPHLDQVLADLGYAGRKVAVAVNETFVPRAGWRERVIEEGDRLDVVAPIQGG